MSNAIGGYVRRGDRRYIPPEHATMRPQAKPAACDHRVPVDAYCKTCARTKT